MAMQEVSVINKDGEEIVITQIVEEPGSQEIHAGATVVQFHHRDCSQPDRKSEHETTLTASEPEDLVTPAQITKSPRDDAPLPLPRKKSAVGDDHLMETSSPSQPQLSNESSGFWQVSAERETGKSKRGQSSTDEESDNGNVVGMGVGRIVNMFSRKGSDNKKLRNK